MKKKKKKAPRPNHEQKEGKINAEVRSYRTDENVLRYLWDFPTYTVSEDTEILHIHMNSDPNNQIPTLFGAN